MKGKRKCKRCNGTGKVFKAEKGGTPWYMSSGEPKGDTCPRCGGTGEVG